MTRIVEFPDRGALAEEAATWLIRLDSDTPPAPGELKALGEWLHRSPAHREELESLAALWGRMNVLTELAVPLEISGRRTARADSIGAVAAKRSMWRVGLFAASLAIVIALGSALLARRQPANPLLETNGLYATVVGQQKTTTLADGSEVTLNTNSQIKVDYGEGYRRVHLLQGEALFTVAKNAERPFRVYAGTGRIEALGTAFLVYLNGADVSITVAEGRVALASIKPSRSEESLGTLNAGQTAIIRSSASQATAGSGGSLQAIEPIVPEELAHRLAWRDGVLIFSGERLEDVVKELGRYTSVSIEIPDEAVRNMRVGGRFPVGETETMLAALETNFNLRVTRLSRNHVVLTAADE